MVKFRFKISIETRTRNFQRIFWLGWLQETLATLDRVLQNWSCPSLLLLKYEPNEFQILVACRCLGCNRIPYFLECS